MKNIKSGMCLKVKRVISTIYPKKEHGVVVVLTGTLPKCTHASFRRRTQIWDILCENDKETLRKNLALRVEVMHNEKQSLVLYHQATSQLTTLLFIFTELMCCHVCDISYF